MGGEPYTWRRVSTVRRQAVGNLPPKGGTAPTAEPTDNERELNQDMENLVARLSGIEEFAGCTI